MQGQFVWYELTTPDVDGARRFYPSITGWGTQQFDKDYTMWTNGGAPIGGIFRLGPEQRQKGIPPNWMPYIEADNVDETARRATLLGGRVVHGPQDIPGTGRFAVLQDPQGATFGIYKSNRGSQGWDGTFVLGRFSWHELATTDYRKAFEFYRQLFGWEKTTEMDMGGGNMYSMYGQKGKSFGGMYNKGPEMAQYPPGWLVYAHVKDVQKAVEAATRAGASVKQPPMDVPGGKIAVLTDPQGATFAVHAGVEAQASKPAAKASPPAAKKASPPTAAKKASPPAARKKARPKSKVGAKKARPKAKAAARKKTASRKRPAARKSSRKTKAKSKSARRRR